MGEQLTKADIERMLDAARATNPPIKPLVINGKEYYVLQPANAGPDVEGSMVISLPSGGEGKAYPL